MDNLFSQCEEYLQSLGFVKETDQFIYTIEQGHFVELSISYLEHLGTKKIILELYYTRDIPGHNYYFEKMSSGHFVDDIQQVKFLVENNLRFLCCVETRENVVKAKV